MAEVLKEHEYKVNSVQLIPSDGGKFEVMVDDKLVYSKLQTGQHVESGEVAKLVGSAL